jgi:hypothetical protein
VPRAQQRQAHLAICCSCISKNDSATAAGAVVKRCVSDVLSPCHVPSSCRHTVPSVFVFLEPNQQQSRRQVKKRVTLPPCCISNSSGGMQQRNTARTPQRGGWFELQRARLSLALCLASDCGSA